MAHSSAPITIDYSGLPSTGHPSYPPGFRARRGLNWGFIGLLYASFYLCRYNFSFANTAMSKEFGYDKGQIGWIISISLFAYACGQITNGLLTDKIGGKRAMLIGAVWLGDSEHRLRRGVVRRRLRTVSRDSWS